ncbi:hypothetical protein ACFSHT_30080 [Paraburkholderia silviterrae]|uniref:Uncharacterized protein n=1 Tax=Paraburkholderia silviterrae TaxID=2528715 RepID=A0A4R5LXK3_9BURK|nr:hypothetical protein [Paraburkholderia silviterrae]TDG16851.1 hypothetical protein EYW47_39495 [Paraburkholderia silviterrae]
MLSSGKQKLSGYSRNLLSRTPLSGSVNLFGTGVSHRPVTTFAELRPGVSETPVPLSKALLRTTYDRFDVLKQKNVGYFDDVEELPEIHVSSFPYVKFFMVGNTLWAAGVDATHAIQIFETLKVAAGYLGVTTAELGDIACLKNLNHESDDPATNIELHMDVIEALISLNEYDSELFTHLEITSHKKNWKLPRERLIERIEELDLEWEDKDEKVTTVSVSNCGQRELPHDSSTLRIDLQKIRASVSRPGEKDL